MKKLYALALAAMLTASMNAFAGTDTKTCNKADAKYCEIKDACCRNADRCDKTKCDKTCAKKSETKAEKKAS